METPIQAVGIDLGNSNTMLATINALGKSEILKHPSGKPTLPSCVFFDDTRTIVGEEAILRGRRHPQRFASQVKNDLGLSFYHQPISGVNLPPEVIQAALLRQLRGSLTAKFPNDYRVALAVPAIFNELQRRSLMEAAEMAGMHSVDLVDEPIAAVLAYAEQFPLFMLNTAPQERRLFLVLNLGGYSSEVSLLSWENNELSMLATEFDEHLGGHEWDLRLVDLFAEQKIKAGQADPREVSLELQRLMENAGQWKIKLDASTEHSIESTEQNFQFHLTAQEFSALTADLRQRLTMLLDKVCATAKQNPQRVQHTLLVGGASQMHFLHELVLLKTGKPPEASLSPGEAIARGAARFAWRQIAQEGSTTSKHWNLTSVCTQSVGIEEQDVVTGRKSIRVFIPRGTKLPATATKEFLTHAKESTLELPLMQGSEGADPLSWRLIGRAILTNLPADAQNDWPLDITIKMGINGRITLDAAVRYTPCVVHLVLHRPDCVSATHIQRWQPVVESQGGLAAYMQTARQEQTTTLQLPVVLASNQPSHADAEQTTAATDTHGNSGGVFDFMKRMMPSFFRKSTSEQKSSNEKQPGANPTPAAAPRPRPPMLEIVTSKDDPNG